MWCANVLGHQCWGNYMQNDCIIYFKNIKKLFGGCQMVKKDNHLKKHNS